MDQEGLSPLRRRMRRLVPWIPNGLSVLRIVLSPAVFPAAGDAGLLFAVLLVCGVTDVLDGWLARRFGWQSALGSRLDSWGDLVFFGCLTGYLAVYQGPALMANLGWLGAVAGTRGLGALVSWIRNRRVVFLHTWANKAAGLAVFAGVSALVLFQAEAAVTAVLVLAWLAGVEELVIFLTVKDPDPDIWGIAARPRSRIKKT